MKKLILLITVIALSVSISLAQSSKFDFGGNLGTNYLVGDSPIEDSYISPNVGLYSIYNYSSRLAFKFQVGFGQMKTNFSTIKLTTNMIPVELVGMYYLKQGSHFLPFIHAGVGIMSFTMGTSNFTSDRYYDGMFIGGTGFQMPLSEKVSFLASADMRYTTGDDFNGYNSGLGDGYFSVQGGLTFHLSKPEYYRKEQKRQTDIIADLMNNPVNPGTQNATQNRPAGGSEDNLLNVIQLRSSIEKLNGELEKKDAQIEELKTLVKIKNQKIALYEKQIADLQSGQPGTNQRQPINARKPIQPQVTNTQTGKTFSVQQRYKNALNNFNVRNYRAAIMEFSNLVNEFPNHKLAGNFIYWIGESYFGMKNFASAIEAFKNVLKYKSSPKYDDALIMSGISYLKTGDTSSAKLKFEELLSKFPKSEYAGKARRYLQQIQAKVIS